MQLRGGVNTLHFDFGALKELSGALASLESRRPMLVTDPGLLATGIVDRVREAAGGSFAAEYSETPPNPDEASTKAAHTAFLESNCDSVVALGGGSSMDLAKGVALLATHDGELASYGASRGGLGAIGPVAPLIAIPTTAGTGSEVSVGAVIILEDGQKETFVAPTLIPRIALCDPELTISMPPWLTAATGMDAVTHCIESALTPAFAPHLEAVAYDGLERAVAQGNLQRAVDDGGDRSARWEMLLASTEGALAFQKGLGPVHALSHATGRLPLRLHHGTLNAIFLPGVLRFGEGAVPEKYTKLARAMGLEEGKSIADATDQLRESLGLPEKLGPLGVKEEDIDSIVRYAQADIAHRGGVKRVSAEDYERMVRDVL
ncbi:MAG: iron-containing alcohol dehydrogenase [Acidobacteriota bacterium]